MGRLNGKVAIVTGSARGIGEATARLFAAEGARVLVADCLGDEVRNVAAGIGSSAMPFELDISVESAWEAAVQSVVEQWGTIDILVNNAAVALYKPMLETSEAEFTRVLNINVTGTFLGMRSVIPVMKNAGKGSIVNISSLNGMRGTIGMIAYDASKWAIRGMTKTVSLEVAAHGIRCNSIHPGIIETPMLIPDDSISTQAMAESFGVPCGRVGLPSEIAHASLFLASDDASYVSGAELSVDGAWGAGIGTNAQQIIDES